MNRTMALIAGCLLSVTSLGANAQSPAVALQMDSGFYVGAGLGRSEARDFCTIVAGACDAKDMSWNVYAGYQFNRHFALEGGFTNFGQATSSGFSGGVPSKISTDTTAFELVAVGLLPFTDRFSLFGKAGFFRYDSDGTISGGVVAGASDTGTEFTFGLGAEYGFARNLAARLEWQRYLGVGSGLLGLPKADISVLRLGARYKF